MIATRTGNAGGAAMRRLLQRAFLVLVGALLTGFVALHLVVHAQSNIVFIDWWVYALGAERALGDESLYLAEQLVGPYRLPDVTPEGYAYPPPSAILFAPFALGEVGRVAWVVANLAVFFSGLGAVLRRELGAVRDVPLALVLLGLLVTVPLPPDGRLLLPFVDGVATANVNVALAGLVAWSWAVGDRRRWMPWVAGAGAAFKIFPGALALWAARRYGWRSLVIATGVAAAIVLLTLPLQGLDEWRRFATALSNAEPACDSGRTSIVCLTQGIIGTSPAKLFAIAVGGGLLALSIVVKREFLAFVLLTLGMLAPVTDGHMHYFLFIYVLLVIGVSRWVGRRRGVRARVRQSAPGAAG